MLLLLLLLLLLPTRPQLPLLRQLPPQLP